MLLHLESNNLGKLIRVVVRPVQEKSPQEHLDSNFELESELLLLCSTVSQDVEKSHRISVILGQALNWDDIFRIALRNGLLPLVSWTLLQKHSKVLPNEVHAQLTDFHIGHTKSNLFLTLKLIECVKILGRENIHVLPFKGATLAHQAYGNLSLRHYMDLDILVQPKHFAKAVEILSENGYIPVANTSWLKRKTRFFTREKDIRLFSSDGKICLELHWKLSGSHFALPVEINQLWKRLETIDLGGSKLNALAFDDLFVYLCLHGSRHGWEKFSWICDLHELLRATEKSESKIDWGAVQLHARQHGCEKVLELGVFLVENFFELRSDYPEIDRILADETYRKIADDLRINAFATTPKHNEISDWYMYHLALKERPIDRMRIRLIYLIRYLKIAFTPTELDEEVFHLPALFFPFYYILRPFRLLLNYKKRRPRINLP